MARYNTLPYSLGGIPPTSIASAQGKQIFVKPIGGSAGNSGKTPAGATNSLSAALALATADQNDIVFFCSESNTAASTSDLYTSALAWNKDLTHIIGQNSASLYSPRSRVGWAASASKSVDTVLFTCSANACRIENMQFITEVADANLAFPVLVSGMRNHFKNCHFAGIVNATLDATGAYSLKVSGNENYFEDCVIGVDTIIRAATDNNELVISGKNNTFKNCIIISWSEVSGRCAVKIDNSGGNNMRHNLFDQCKFINWTDGLATGNTNVFDMPASGSTAYVYLNDCSAFGGGAAGVGAAWSDTDTSIFISNGATCSNAGGKSVAAA